MSKEEVDDVRQGDIRLVKVNNIKKSKKIAENKYILAYGEKTGHSHVMKGDVQFFENGDGTIVCQVGKSAELVHEPITDSDHEPITIPSGDWVVIKQREFDLVEGIRRVSD